MDLRLACPSCGRSYTFRETHVGRKARCSKCATTFEVTTVAGSANSTVAPARKASASSTIAPGAEPTRAEPPAAEQVTVEGRRLGRFTIKQELGAGSFGAVYRAFDDVLKRDVALKLPHAAALALSGVGERFLREAEAAAQLHHPHIVPIFDAGAEGDQLYIASAFIDGKTLQGVAAERRPSGSESARLIMKLALALDYAHSKNVVHRDVKPANVMIDIDGEPHLMDFGLARWEQADQQLTQEGSLLGTPAYMSPEQAGAPVGPIGPASDQYALGVMLYELLCGRVPFQHPMMAMLLNLIRDQEPQRPRALVPQIPLDLETICVKAMAKRPADRYPRASALAEDLRRYLDGEAILARRLGPIERLTRWAGRNKAVAGLTAGVAALLVVVAGVSLFSAARMSVLRNREAEATQTAVEQARRAEEEQRRAEKSAQVADQERLKAQTEATRAQEEKQKADQSAAIAQQERQKATTSAEEAETRRVEAVLSADKLRRQLYAVDMYLLQKQNQPWRLGRHVPQPNQTDLRGFEWYYLNRRFTKAPQRQLSAAGDSGGAYVHHTSVAYSPDGKLLAVAGRAMRLEVVVWNTADWSVRNRFQVRSRDPGERIKRLSFSADSTKLVGSLDPANTQGTAWICDLATGESLDADVGPTISMSRDGKRFVTVRAPRELERTKFQPHIAFFDDREIQDRKLLSMPAGAKPLYPARAAPAKHVIPIQSETVDLLLSPDGRRLIYAGKAEGVRLYDVEKRKEIRLLDADADQRYFAFNDDGTWLAIAKPGETRVENVNTGAVTIAPKAGSTDLSFFPDKKSLATSDEWGTQVWELASGNVLQSMSKSAGICSVSPDGRYIATGTGGGGIQIWGTGTDLEIIPADIDNVMELLSSPDGKLLAVCKYDRTVDLYEFASGRRVHTLPGEPIHIQRPVLDHRRPQAGIFSRDGKRIALLAADDRLKIWDTATGRELLTLEGTQKEVFQIAFNSDGKSIAVAGDDPLMKVWDVETGRVLRSADKASTDKFARIFFSGLGSKLVQVTNASQNRGVRTSNGGVRVETTQESGITVWDVATGSKQVLLEKRRGYMGAAAFSPDEANLLVQYVGLNSGSGGELFDTATGRSLGKRAFGLFSPAGNRLIQSDFATDNQTYVVKIVDFVGGATVSQLEDTGIPTGQALVPSPDGGRLYCGGRLWDVETGMAVFDPEFTVRDRHVVFSADSKYLVLGGPQGLAIFDGSPTR